MLLDHALSCVANSWMASLHVGPHVEARTSNFTTLRKLHHGLEHTSHADVSDVLAAAAIVHAIFQRNVLEPRHEEVRHICHFLLRHWRNITRWDNALSNISHQEVRLVIIHSIPGMISRSEKASAIALQA